jgi:chromosome segregation ATPase
MKQQLEQRLKELKAEFESGQKALAELENRQADLRNTLLRISGAIQVLEEELGKFDSDSAGLLPQSSLILEQPVESEPEDVTA